MNTTTLTAGDPAPDFSGVAVGAEFADGKPFRTERTTFVIAPEGRMKAILRKVDPCTHDRLLLEALYS